MHFQPMPIGLEPCPDLPVFVVGSVVLNQNGSPATVASGQLVEEAKVGCGIEDCLLAVVKSRAPQLDRAENLNGLARTGDGNLRGTAHATPSRVQRRVLPEAGLVGEDQRPVKRLGFFLRAG